MRLRKLFARALVALIFAGWGVGAIAPDAARGQDDSNAKQELAKEYKAAQQALSNNNYQQAATHLENVVDLAEQTGQDDLLQSVRDNLGKLRYNVGNSLIKQENYQAAKDQFNASFEFAPNFAPSYFGMALALRRQDSTELAMQWYRRAINEAQSQNNQTIVNKARTNMAAIFLERANQAFQQESFEQSITHLDSARKYIDASAEHHFYYARAHNGLGNWQESLEHANQGLELVNRSNRQLTSNLLYMRGVAEKNMGNLQAARNTLEQVDAGPYQQNAQYELKHNLDDVGGGGQSE